MGSPRCTHPLPRRNLLPSPYLLRVVMTLNSGRRVEGLGKSALYSIFRLLVCPKSMPVHAMWEKYFPSPISHETLIC